MRIAVIGAGPAGLSSAIKLGKEKHEVIVFERGLVGENIICAEGFFDYYGRIDIELPDKIEIKKLIVQDKETYEIPLPSKGRFYTFDRKKWQQTLAEKAKSFGAKIEENTKIGKEDLKNLMKDFDYLIDASGVKAISHHLFPREDVLKYRKYLMPSIQYKISGDFSKFYDTIKVILTNNPPGYFWIFPKRDGNLINFANVGLGLLSKTSSMPNLRKLLTEMLIKENIKMKETKTMASPIPTKRLKQYRYKNIILSGDALGLCSPLHGGGIDSAYLSGCYIAKSIIKNDFSIYEKFLKNVDKRFFIERFFLTLWEKFGSHKILSRLKNKGLFNERSDNIPLTKSWYLKALVRLII